MVVGEDQTGFRNGNTGTATAKDDDSIGHTRIGLAIQLVDRRDKSQLGHTGQILLVQLFHDPHTLIGKQLSGSCQQQQE